MPPTTRHRPARHQRGDFTTHFGAFLILVFFPALWTAISPRVTVEMQRRAEGVHVLTCAHTLFVIPYWCQTQARVTRLELEVFAGERMRYRSDDPAPFNRPNQPRYTEPNATLHFLGDDFGEGASVMVEIGRMDEVLAQAQAFLDDPRSASLSQSFYAHRPFGLYLGLPFSLLVLLWLPLVGLAITRKLLGRPYWPFDG
jgi:hypothetical protein